MEAIFTHKKKLHRVTIRDKGSTGRQKWTLFEMWPAPDISPQGSQPAMLVSALDVTHHRMIELQLENAKDQLLR